MKAETEKGGSQVSPVQRGLGADRVPPQKLNKGHHTFCLLEATSVSLFLFSRKILTGGGSFRRREKEEHRLSVGIKTEHVGKTRRGLLLRPPGTPCLRPAGLIWVPFHFSLLLL